jgi:outer membrane lipoprotein-sorting protein
MKRVFIAMLLLLAAQCAFSQSAQIKAIMEKRNTNRVSLDYSCTFTRQAPLKLDGTLLIQGDCYLAKGNGMEIYCNGKTRWTVDPESREVYIENAGGIAELMKYKDSMTGLSVSNVKYSPLSEDIDTFTFNTRKLDSSWVVTDLRQE